MQNILLTWQLSNRHGWGIAGLNIFCQWALMPDVRPMMLFPIEGTDIAIPDPQQREQIRQAVEFSNECAVRLTKMLLAKQQITVDIPVVHGLGNSFTTADEGLVKGAWNLGRIVFESSKTPAELPRNDRFDHFLCASEWNASVLRAHTQKPVQVVHEGVNPLLFRPGSRSGALAPGRFYIFTGGKIEYRKAQDLVLLAFREFSRRHDDAVLVAAWHSPWPNMAKGFQGRLDAPLELNADGKIDVTKWAADNGIDPSKVIDAGSIPNQAMPVILREMDCALQPSRAEGGTNFVAMEAMACGVPVIIARNTGAIDLIAENNCIALERQSPVADIEQLGCEGWGESSVDEIVEALERFYASSTLRKEIGAAGAAFMRERTWQKHAEQLKELIFSL